MTQQEFSARTGLNPTNEEYEVIEAMYMATRNMDKDIFCEEYKKHKDSKLLAYFYKSTEDAKFCAKLIDKSMLKAAKFLLTKSREFNDKFMRAEAINLLGEKMIVKLTIEMDLELWNEDKEYIITNIQ